MGRLTTTGVTSIARNPFGLSLSKPSLSPEPTPALQNQGVSDWFDRYPAVERARSRAGEWWAKRSPSEQRLLIALGCVLALAILVAGVYRPLADARAQATADIRTYSALTQQLRTAGSDLARLRARQNGDPQAILTGSAPGYGLTLGAVRVEGALVRATLANQDFSRLTQWMAQVETISGLRLAEVRVTRAATPGLVNAEVAFRP